jgi:cob(I)alamin adenosyltransferase
VRTEHAVIRKALTTIQKELLRVGAVLAAVVGGRRPEVRLRQSSVARLEKQMDAICGELPELKHFVLPGGCELAARLHLARVVARRAERTVVTMMNLAGRAGRKDSPAAVVARYLNRLSDFLFALARLANRDAGLEDAVWKP